MTSTTRHPDEGGAVALGEGDRATAELVGVSKRFDTVYAVRDVSLELRAGEVLALVGENGAGKSTCVKMLGGVYQPSEGQIRVNGEDVALRTPLDAQHLGIAVVHQHPGLFPDLPIYENVYAGRPLTTRFGLLDHARMSRESRRWLEILGLQVDPVMTTGQLSTSEQQLVEIAKALAFDARILILDEPTASLTMGETQRLFTVIQDLKVRGVAMLFVGHRLEEIMAVSDRVTVMRDGRRVADLVTADTDEHRIVELMVGRELTDIYPPKVATIGDIVLRLRDLGVTGRFSGIDLDVRAGEIVGLAGLVGAGRTEVARAVFGIDKVATGTVELDGKPVRIASPAAALAHGIAYVSEDRRGQSIIEDFSILDNATLPVLDQASRAGLIRRRAEFALVDGPLQRMRLKFAGYAQPIGNLSGGNQQKVVLAKWLATRPRLLILDEPTQGVDIQAKAEVHHIIAELAEQGLAILMISSDMPELLGTCDRIYVMHQGRITAEFDAEHANQIDIGLAATGLLVAGREPGTTTTADVRALEARQESELVSVGESPGRRQWWRKALARREFGLLIAVAAILVPLGLINPNLVSASNIGDLGVTTALYGVACLGQMTVMLTRNIDLSQGSVIGLSAYVSAWTMSSLPDAPAVLGIAVAIAVGLVCGAVNGVIIAYGRVPSIVVTLGTLAIFRGIDAILSSGRQISSSMVPPGWLAWTAGRFLGVSLLVYIGLLLFIVFAVFLRTTRVGRDVYATGSNPAGADLIGIRTKARTFTAFVISGTLAGFAGAMWASHFATVDGQLAYGLELTLVASVVVGGVSLRGGTGSVLGVLLGTITLIIIQNAITVARINPSYLQAFFGGAILLTVLVDTLLSRRSTRGVR
ncbi:ATP-binding cassette domain-containing protein [Nakamurella flavida]|uniref:ATP-binding cassette domain-containing protein n=1 Tax=Nakamurella flavida TaxID=363630 RepID=A0A939C4D1_9ACTN|nr:ATP-binding cassette domain-containing protein [Nakamurella flavida]MBM9477976.1 ATP-binding cassette domain-containing protein [Nakamurella flavida]MDP9778308.1 ABC-type sugar transport system ATPase subunit/ribose/xylose/arabinose/galactoside ABC-type transport system permease subunit [Nakamurella flavida]